MSGQNYVYTMQHVGKVYPGGREVLKDINLQFLPGAKIGVLGLNGAGKSTLLRVMAGVEESSSGDAWAAKGIRVGYLSQEPELNDDKSVAENIMEALGEMKEVWDRFHEVSAALGEEMEMEKMEVLLDEQGELQEKIDAADMWDMDRVVDVAMEALRCPSGDSGTKNLSGGERRRVALCRLLLSKPDMLLLDEPTNHLDALTVAWLQRYLVDYKGTVVMVTHDRYFLDHVTGWILELDRGEGIPYKGNYSSWLGKKQERLHQAGKVDSERLRTLVKEKEWAGSSPSARRAKGKARIRAYEELVEEHASRGKQSGPVTIRVPLSQRLGDVVVEAKELRKVYDDKLLFEGVSFRLPPGGIVGVIGGNGAGKTTLMRMIMGQETADGGSLRLGETVDLGYVDQSRDVLNPSHSVFEAISDGEERMMIEGREVQGRAYVGAFNFKGSDQEKKVGKLSGGERNRVHLARILKKGCNLLLLDEPTNDLDVETLRSLEDALESFPGSVVVVSHDRWFLDRMASHILAFEGDSKVVWFEGNYEEYEEDRRKRLGLEADQPKPIKYRPLTV